MQQAAKSQLGDKATHYRMHIPIKKALFVWVLSIKRTTLLLCALEYDLQCCRSVHCAALLKYTTIAAPRVDLLQ